MYTLGRTSGHAILKEEETGVYQELWLEDERCLVPRCRAKCFGESPNQANIDRGRES
jgi:hypothetical protein